ncbi:MAG TPA: hydrolase [Candidatus Omnitrophota bacterium]|nr:hydrolase [Candidatus Omnitrophota bacterium]
MRFTTDKSVLLVIDVQGKLAHLMHQKDELFRNLQTLIKAAHLFAIPVLLTEQAPQKIGETIEEIKQVLKEKPIGKTAFSCCGEDEFVRRLRALKRKQIIVCGIETHVCVYQTVCDLREMQYEVQVVANAVSSRVEENKNLALGRIQLTGATLTSTEMLICELMKGADHPKFKEVMGLIK